MTLILVNILLNFEINRCSLDMIQNFYIETDTRKVHAPTICMNCIFNQVMAENIPNQFYAFLNLLQVVKSLFL